MKTDQNNRESRMNKTIVDFLIDIPMFDRIKADELSVIARHMNLIELDKDEILFKEGDKGDYVCFVVDGVLNVLKRSDTGKNAVIARLGKGRSIGEMAIIDNTPRSASILAATKTVLLTLPQKGFETILEENPKIGIKILKGLSRLLSMNLRKTSSQLADYMLITN